MAERDGLTSRQVKNIRKGALSQERSSWFTQWQEISRYLLPRNGRFLIGDVNKGDKRHNNIYDSTGTRALRVLAAGLMAGMTSPARPWFRLKIADKDLMEYTPVKMWLNAVTELMRDIFNASNTYRALHGLYEELGAFGTAATILLPRYETVIHHFPLTVGEYMLAQNEFGEVDTLYREFQMTVAQIFGQFVTKRSKSGSADWSNVSQTVKNMYDTNKLDQWVDVVHVVEPRTERDTRYKDAKNMPFASCYYEANQGAMDNMYLSESGFKRFPALAPRWAGVSCDIYGNSPGMETLGDIKQLQHQQLRKGQGIDYLVKPPIQVPTSFKSHDLDSLPGGVNFVDSAGPSGGMKNAFEVNINLEHLLMDIIDVRQRIDETFYKNLFLAVINDTRQQPGTAREIAEKHEEKLLMIGPVLERLHNELLKRKVDVTFEEMLHAGIVPPPPPELQDHELQVQFVSMLAQAQQAVGTGAIDRFVGSLGAIAQFKPGVLDKFDEDEWADQYSEMLGVDPSLIVGDEKVAIVRQNRAQQQKQQAAAEQAQQIAQTAKTAGDTNVSNVQDILGLFSGYQSPTGVEA